VSGSSYLHELFEAQVDACGDAVAVVCGPVSLSYAGLETRANRLANYLRQLGVGPGSFVGLAFDRSELPIVAILGCLKAGAAYVPIDTTHPDQRIRYMVEEAEIAVLLSERALLERTSRVFTGRIVALDAGDGHELWEYQATPRLYLFSNVAAADGTAYVGGMDGSVTALVRR